MSLERCHWMPASTPTNVLLILLGIKPAELFQLKLSLTNSGTLNHEDLLETIHPTCFRKGHDIAVQLNFFCDMTEI